MTGPPAGLVGLKTRVQGRKSKGAAPAAPFGFGNSGPLLPRTTGSAGVCRLWPECGHGVPRLRRLSGGRRRCADYHPRRAEGRRPPLDSRSPWLAHFRRHRPARRHPQKRQHPER